MRRRLYLIVLVVILVVGLAVLAAYGRKRGAQQPAKAGCDTPAPQQAATPPPKLPDFAVEAPCGPGGAQPAAKPAQKKRP